VKIPSPQVTPAENSNPSDRNDARPSGRPAGGGRRARGATTPEEGIPSADQLRRLLKRLCTGLALGAGFWGLGGGLVRAAEAPTTPKPPTSAAPAAAVASGGVRWGADPLLVSDPGLGLPFAVDDTAVPAGDPASSENEWVAAPVPFINSLLGFGVSAGAAYIYHPPGQDKKLPPWTTGVGVFYSESKSWGVALGHKMNLRSDTWRVTGLMGYGSVNYDFYGIGAAAGNNPQSVSLHQTILGLTAEGLVRIKDHFYTGLNYSLSQVKTRATDSSLPPWFTGIVSGRELSAVLSLPALRVQWDSRDNTFLPARGWLVDGEAAFSDQSFGSDYTFQALSVAAKHYWRLSDRLTVAAFGYGRFAYGDLPFFELSRIGAKGNLRGYSVGRYQDRMVLTGQVEYRWQVWRRLGVVAFGGLGAVAPDLSGLFHTTTLPSVGGGVRYLLTEKNKINFRLDVAWGRDERLFYLGVGEAF